MIVGKEMLLGVDGKQVEMEMIECQLAVSSKGVMEYCKYCSTYYNTVSLLQ